MFSIKEADSRLFPVMEQPIMRRRKVAQSWGGIGAKDAIPVRRSSSWGNSPVSSDGKPKQIRPFKRKVRRARRAKDRAASMQLEKEFAEFDELAEMAREANLELGELSDDDAVEQHDEEFQSLLPFPQTAVDKRSPSNSEFRDRAGLPQLRVSVEDVDSCKLIKRLPLPHSSSPSLLSPAQSCSPQGFSPLSIPEDLHDAFHFVRESEAQKGVGASLESTRVYFEQQRSALRKELRRSEEAARALEQSEQSGSHFRSARRKMKQRVVEHKLRKVRDEAERKRAMLCSVESTLLQLSLHLRVLSETTHQDEGFTILDMTESATPRPSANGPIVFSGKVELLRSRASSVPTVVSLSAHARPHLSVPRELSSTDEEMDEEASASVEQAARQEDSDEDDMPQLIYPMGRRLSNIQEDDASSNSDSDSDTDEDVPALLFPPPGQLIDLKDPTTFVGARARVTRSATVATVLSSLELNYGDESSELDSVCSEDVWEEEQEQSPMYQEYTSSAVGCGLTSLVRSLQGLSKKGGNTKPKAGLSASSDWQEMKHAEPVTQDSVLTLGSRNRMSSDDDFAASSAIQRVLASDGDKPRKEGLHHAVRATSSQSLLSLFEDSGSEEEEEVSKLEIMSEQLGQHESLEQELMGTLTQLNDDNAQHKQEINSLLSQIEQLHEVVQAHRRAFASFGTPVVKFHRDASLSSCGKRWISLSADQKYIEWRKKPHSTAPSRALVSDIIEVHRGIKTEVLSSQANTLSNRENLCLSIILPTRTLDLVMTELAHAESWWHLFESYLGIKCVE